MRREGRSEDGEGIARHSKVSNMRGEDFSKFDALNTQFEAFGGGNSSEM